MDRHIEKTILRLIPVSVMVLCIICIIMGSRISFLESRIAGREAFEQLGNRDSRLVRISEYDYIPEDTSVAHADEAYASAGVIEDNVSDGSESGTAANHLDTTAKTDPELSMHPIQNGTGSTGSILPLMTAPVSIPMISLMS